jgi:hypothetical protein
MAFLPPAIFEIKAVADKAIAEFKQVNNELGKMESQAEKAGGSIGGIDKASRVANAGLLAMGAAFAGFAAIGIKEAMEAETVMTKLNATLASQGLNTAGTRKEIDDLSKSFVKLGFDDEAASASMQVLIQSTGDLTKSKGLLSMAADLARAKTISLESASQMLVRANMGAGKVFKQFGITLDTTLPKAEATSKAMAELKEKLSGQAQKAAETFTVQLQILKEQFNNVAQSLGEVLLPYLKKAVEMFNNTIEFVKRNSTAFQIFGGVILVVTLALASYAITLKVITAATKAYAFIQGVAKTTTALLTGQQVALNGAMAVNPIGLVVMAVVALIGVLVILWNKSDTFRKGVIAMSKAALNSFAAIIPIVADVGESFIRFLLNPVKLVLTVLSKLPGVGKYAKTGLDLINNGLDGIAGFAEKAAAKAKTLANGLDKFNKPIKIKFLETEIPDFGNKGKGKGTGKGLTPEQKKAKEEIKKANEDYMKIVKDFQDKVTSAQNKFNEKMTKIDKDYKEETAKLNKDAQERIDKLNKDAGEKKLKAELETNKRITEAQTRFNDEMGKLNAKKADDLAKLAKDNQDKIASITKSGNDKLQSIIQQSVDRLRNAFAKGTEFSVTDLFKGLTESGSQNAEGLLAAIKNKLVGAKELAKNAAILQAQGFSQTFIEQIVGAGPEVGNQLAESLKNATPETIQELQKTFLDMENTQNSGLDVLAKEMNKGARLATSELNDAYKDAQQDLAVALTDQAKQYAEAQTEINKTFNEATAEAERTRDSAIASLKADLADTLVEIDKELRESIAEVNKNLQDALSEAFVKFQEAQADARKELSDTLAEIEKDMVDKLGSITNATNATISAITALSAALANAKTFTAPTVQVPAQNDSVASYGITDALKKTGALNEREYMRESGGKNLVINAPVTNYNTTSPEDIGNTFVRLAKYGMAVTG